MAESLFKLSNLTEKLECGLCHDTLFDPKDLPCQHSFCCDCFDGIAVFREDGSATLQCPYNCEGTIVVGVNESISSTLKSNYATQHVLDFIKESKGKKMSLCQDENNCKAPACYSCSVCSKKTCSDCWETHTCTNKMSTYVVFDERNESFKAVCKKHKAHVKSICIDCSDQFLCVYCLNREHKGHHYDTLENQVAITKGMMLEEFEKIKKDHHCSNISYKDELEKIEELRNDLEVELLERTAKKLSEFAAVLTDQKNDLLQTFDTKVEEFKANLNEFGLIDNDYEKVFSSYIDWTNTKPYFEILFEKDEIIRKSKSLSSPHCFLASLTDYDMKEKTVGELHMSLFHKTDVNEGNDIIEVSFKKAYESDEKFKYDLDQLTKYISDLKLTSHAEKRQRFLAYTYDDVVQLIKNDNINEIKLLLKYRADVVHMKSGSNKKETLIYIAASLGKVDILRLILDVSNEHINDICCSGMAALMRASANGHASCVKVLLANHADVNIKDIYGWTALMRASANGHTSCVEVLLANHADINIKNNSGTTALMRASANGQTSCVKVLLANHADINIKDSSGNTAYHYTTRNEIKQMINAHKTKQ